MLTGYKTVIVLVSILILSLTVGSILAFQSVYGDPNDTNMSDFIEKSKQSLAKGNIKGAIANLTMAVELQAIIEPKNFYNFVAAGDFDCGDEVDNTVKNILERNPDLVIGLGDYSYSPFADCWFGKTAPIDSIIKIVIGNHDVNHDVNPDYLLHQYLDHYKLKDQYYSFDYGVVHFLVMSTEVPFALSSPQYDFVNNDLQKASKDPKIKWIVVANHIPTYKTEQYWNSKDFATQEQFQVIYHPLFDEYKVDLVLQGHTHDYQRTYPLKYNPMEPKTPTITDRHKNNYINPDGAVFLTIGTGGKGVIVALPSGSKAGVEHNAHEILLEGHKEPFGILDLKVKKDGSLLEGTFYNNDDPHKPLVGDYFSITKKEQIPIFENTIRIAEFEHIIAQRDNTVFIKLIGKDKDPNDILRYSIVSNPIHGNLANFNSNTGEIYYTPEINFTGTDIFTFKVLDSKDAESNVANVTVTVKL